MRISDYICNLTPNKKGRRKKQSSILYNTSTERKKVDNLKTKSNLTQAYSVYNLFLQDCVPSRLPFDKRLHRSRISTNTSPAFYVEKHIHKTVSSHGSEQRGLCCLREGGASCRENNKKGETVQLSHPAYRRS